MKYLPEVILVFVVICLLLVLGMTAVNYKVCKERGGIYVSYHCLKKELLLDD